VPADTVLMRSLWMPWHMSWWIGVVFAVGRGQRKAFSEAVTMLRAFRRAYRDAFEQWRSGVRSVVFPQGTWCMCRVHGAVAQT